jgi:hypothetical protein
VGDRGCSQTHGVKESGYGREGGTESFAAKVQLGLEQARR